MKKVLFILLALILFVPSGLQAQTQWVTNSESINFSGYNSGGYSFECTIIGTENLVSNSFTYYLFDGSVEKPSFSYLLSGGSSDSERKISCELQGSWDNINFMKITDIMTSDSVNTQQAKLIDLSTYKAPFLRLKISGTTGNDTTVVKNWIYFPKKD